MLIKKGVILGVNSFEFLLGFIMAIIQFEKNVGDFFPRQTQKIISRKVILNIEKLRNLGVFKFYEFFKFSDVQLNDFIKYSLHKVRFNPCKVRLTLG